jgi:hypothetical protein
MVLSQQTVAAYPERAARHFHRKHFVLLYVLVHGAPIYIDDLSGAGYSDDFDIFTTPRTPDFVPENERLGHTHDALAERRLPCFSTRYMLPALTTPSCVFYS